MWTLWTSLQIDLFLYADNSCLVYHQKDVKKNEQNLEKKFSNACDWFVDNKLIIHSGDDKRKSILFGTKNHLNKVYKVGVRYNAIHIKQYHTVT